MKYATFSADGAAEIRHDASAEVPAGGVLVTDEQYLDLLSGLWIMGLDGEIVQSLAVELTPQPKQFTSLDYLDLFTEAEQLAVVSATMASPQVKLWYDKMLAAGYITSADPRTEGGLAALVGAGLLTEARKVEILAVMA